MQFNHSNIVFRLEIQNPEELSSKNSCEGCIFDEATTGACFQPHLNNEMDFACADHKDVVWKAIGRY